MVPELYLISIERNISQPPSEKYRKEMCIEESPIIRGEKEEYSTVEHSTVSGTNTITRQVVVGKIVHLSSVYGTL